MTRAKRFRVPTAVALLMFISAVCLSLQLLHSTSGKVTAQSVTDNMIPAQEALPCQSCAGPSEQVIYAPTIALPESARSELVLNSRSPNVIDVTPTLYTMEGTPIKGQTLRVQPSEIRFVSIENLIPAEHRKRHRWGGMSLSYTGGTREIWAQLALHGVNGVGSVDVLFTVLKEVGSDTQEGLWWMPERGTAILALGNSSASGVRVTLQYADGQSEEVSIEPFATAYVRRLAARNRSEALARGGYGESVRIKTDGPLGSVRAAGFVSSAGTGFVSSIRFYDPQTTVQPNLFATSLQVKDATPHMLLRNVSDSEVTATPRFIPTGGDAANPVELPALTLKPRETVEVDLAPLVAAAAGRTDLDVVSVKVQSTGPSGSIIGALYSTDAKTGVVYDVPLRDSGPMRNLTGAYPWRLDDDYSTVVSVTNIGEQPARFTVNIFYDGGGKYVLDPQELASGETARFDLKKIRDEQIPDRTGTVIPRSVNRGQFNWSVYGGDDSARLIGRGVVASPSRHVSVSYSCPTCCPNSFYDGFFSPTVISVGVNRFAVIIPQERYRDCYLRMLGPYSAWAQWQISDSTKASITQSQSGQAQVNGLSVGSTTFWGAFTGPVYTDGGQGYCYRYTGYSNPSGTVGIVPRVDGVSPARALIGQPVDVVITGAGFGSSPSVSAGTGITVTVNSASNTEIHARFDIAGNAPGGNHQVTVTASTGQVSNPSGNFYVQIPTNFIPLNLSAANLGCDPNMAGVGGQVLYQVVDQADQAIMFAGLTPQEHVVVNGTNTFPGFRPFATPQTTDANGQFLDIPVGSCFGPPPPTQNLCVNVVQTFNLLSGSVTYTINTTTTRRDCVQGIRVTVQSGSTSRSSMLGTVN